MRLPYSRVGSFKGVLFVAAVAIIASVILYTERMVVDLRESSRQHLTLQVERLRSLFLTDDDEELDLYLTEMARKDFPLIITDAHGRPTNWSGLPELDRLDSLHTGMDSLRTMQVAREYMHEWVRQGKDPVLLEIPEYGLKFYYYYGDSEQIQRLRLMPWIELIAVSGLILIGYLGFANIKKSEERSVWVGMSRETAHQLGTPLTSLYGWVELLEDDPNNKEALTEINNDLDRLRIVADRFQRIGSRTPLKEMLLKPLIEDAADYIRHRLPQLVDREVMIGVEIPADLKVRIDPTLLGWVFENLLKNGIEALKGKPGVVAINGRRKGRWIILDVSDDGCGISRKDWRNVFRPGFTTKKRGWGLGLSLAKRIVEDIHHGHMWIQNSAPEAGTLIRIQLRS